jgi:ComF family protein
VIARTAANAVLSVLLAPVCAGCGAILDRPLDGCVCRNCWDGIRPVADLAFDSGEPLATLTSVGAYDGALREIIHALKYQGRRSIAAKLAAFMRVGAARVLRDADCVVPVPLHWRREHARGFNQARELARHLELPLVEALSRRRRTRPQVELSAEARRANVQGAFEARRPRLLRTTHTVTGLTIVLVDDVATTGATLAACAAVLKDAGALNVRGLTAARTV